MEKGEIKLNTMISYLYRDASNYKARNHIVCKGEFTEPLRKKIMDSLEDSCYFVPEQIGLPITRPDDTLTEDDHGYCELYEDDFTLVDEKPDIECSIEELSEKFSRVGPDGWMDPTFI